MTNKPEEPFLEVEDSILLSVLKITSVNQLLLKAVSSHLPPWVISICWSDTCHQPLGASERLLVHHFTETLVKEYGSQMAWDREMPALTLCSWLSTSPSWTRRLRASRVQNSGCLDYSLNSHRRGKQTQKSIVPRLCWREMGIRNCWDGSESWETREKCFRKLY